MIGITFGQCLFQTSRARVEPDSDVHFGLLLHVAASATGGCLRDDVAEVMWSGSDPDHGRHSLRQAMYRLRQQGFPLHLRAGRVVFDADLAVDVRDVLTVGDSMSREQLLSLGGRPFLPGYAPKLGPVFSDWVDALRVQVAGVLRRGLVEAVRSARADAAFRDVHRLGRALLSLDPLNETATLAVAEALAMDGSKVEALRMLEEYEEEVGAVEENLRIPARTLRRRVSENLGDALLPRRYEVPFVGRVEEFALLRRMFAESRRGAPRCAVITGEAGIGKTRLASELVRLAVLDGATVTTYTCTSGDTVSPLSSLLHLTHALLSLPGALGCGREHLEYLRRIVSSEPPAQSPLDGVAADVAYAQLVYSLTELAAAIADEAPLVIFIDDAHRLHQTSWRLFTDLVDRMHAHGVLLIVTARQLPHWYASLGICGSSGRSQVLRLPTFVEGESRQFLAVWSEKNGVTVTAADSVAIAGWSAGNPFYLSELAAHVGRGADVSQAPPSVRGLIELQYSATTRAAHRVLAAVSLLQSRATAERVTRALGIEPAHFLAALDELEETGLVVATGAELRVKHDLVAEVALGLSSPGVLGYLRFRVASLLEEEAEQTGNLELLGDSLTQWERFGDAKRVYEVGMRLGGRLLPRQLCVEAERAFLRALAFADLPAERTDALEGAISCTAMLQAWDRTKEYSRARRAIGHRRHADLEHTDLDEIEALLWTEATELPGHVLKGARNQALPAALRLRAAEIIAVKADNAWDHESLNTAMDAVKDLGVWESRGRASLLRLVYTTAVGDRESIEQAVDTFLDAPSHVRGRLSFARDQRIAADALTKGGLRARAIDVLEEALEESRRLQLPMQTASALDRLIVIALSELLLGRAETAWNEMRDIVRSALPALDRSLLYNEATLAWALGDRPRSERVVAGILATLESSGTGPDRYGGVLSLVAAYHGAHVKIPTTLADEAVSLALRAKTWGRSDPDIAALLSALKAADRHQQRESVRSVYLSGLERRKMQPSPILARVLEIS